MQRLWFWVLASLCLGGTLAADDPDDRPYGISHRVPWTTSRVIGSPEPPPPYRAARIWPQLAIDQPIYAAPEPGANSVIVVELQRGKNPARLWRFDNRPDVDHADQLLELDRLVYGFAYHPRYVENGYLYLISNGPSDAKPKFNRISRFTVQREAPFAILPDSELVILEWESNGHNGGELVFGHDGMLYCATGDGTSDSDPLETGQGLNDLLAVMLRIDVDHPSADKPYSIPPDNPFLDVPDARGEIWAFGFRNPWRNTVDRKTGQLWVTQNGQDLWEQVYLVRRGENYGWSVQEGSHPFYLNRPKGPGEITPPVAEHHHTEARSLTGGVVYYGSRLPELQGAYIYGDYSTGRIWGIRHDGEKVTWHQELADTSFAIVGFAETQDGALVVIDQHSGFYQLEPAPPEPDRPPFPTRLSDTGLFASVADNVLHPGVIPYSVNAPLWSDGAHKDRYLALPGWSQIDFTNTKAWDFPEGTVLVKTFSIDREAGNPATRQRIETRLLTRQQNEWVGYSYAWNDEQTDAVLVEKAGLDRDFVIQESNGVRKQTWHYPSRTECMVCHSRAAKFVLGLQTEQMNRDHDYGGIVDNQLRTLSHLGVLRVKSQDHPGTAQHWTTLVAAVDRWTSSWTARLGSVRLPTAPAWLTRIGNLLREKPKVFPWLPKPPAEYAAFPDPYDPAQPLESRVRAYLHVNCSVCHQHAGGGNAQMELQFATTLDKTQLIDVLPHHDRFGIEEARLVAPGDPSRSILLQRILKRGRGQMPPLATSLVDDAGAELLESWIRSLKPAEPTVSSR